MANSNIMIRNSLICFAFMVVLSCQVHSQQSAYDLISADELNQHLGSVFEDKKLFKEFVGFDHNGDSAIFVLTDLYPQYAQFNPFDHQGYKIYFWNSEDLFFYNINPTIFKINSYDQGYYHDKIEFIFQKKKTYIVRITLKHRMSSNKRIAPSEIESIQIGKVKWREL